MATATWTSLCVSTPTMTSCAKLLLVLRSLQGRWLWHRWNGRTRLSWDLWSGSYKVTFVLPVRSAPEKADRSPKTHQWPGGGWVRPPPAPSVCRHPQGDSRRRGSNPRLQPWEERRQVSYSIGCLASYLSSLYANRPPLHAKRNAVWSGRRF